MPVISVIAAMDERHGIGKDNRLLCHLPADLKHFKQLTQGKPVIMGRRTYESIGSPLPHRLNIVLSRSMDQQEREKISQAGVVVVSSFNDAIEAAGDVPEIMVIGGVELFRQALPVANYIYLTQIHHVFEADVFFPDIDESVWQLKTSVYRIADERNRYAMTFNCYEHKK